jgi:hypothetical protein
VDERVGSPEVDADVTGEDAEERVEHDSGGVSLDLEGSCEARGAA